MNVERKVPSVQQDLRSPNRDEGQLQLELNTSSPSVARLTCRPSLTPSFSPLPKDSSPAAPTSIQTQEIPSFSAQASVDEVRGAGVRERMVLR